MSFLFTQLELFGDIGHLFYGFKQRYLSYSFKNSEDSPECSSTPIDTVSILIFGPIQLLRLIAAHDQPLGGSLMLQDPGTYHCTAGRIG